MDINSCVSFLFNALISGCNSLLVPGRVVVVVSRKRIFLLAAVGDNTKASVLPMQTNASNSTCRGNSRR
jgi:hypothetical protein